MLASPGRSTWPAAAEAEKASVALTVADTAPLTAAGFDPCRVVLCAAFRRPIPSKPPYGRSDR